MQTFVEFLIELEQNISFDPANDTTASLVAKAKQAFKMASSSPERALRARQQSISDKQKAIKTDTNDPLANERLTIKKSEDRVARMKMNLARKEKNTGAAA